MIKLSILIATIPSRINTFFPKLINELMRQIGDRTDVEVVGLFDNKKRTVGDKRQDLLNLARGEYLVFIDDDNRVAPDYIVSAIDAIYANPNADCIVYDCICTTNGTNPVHCKYGIEYNTYWESADKKQWRGPPAHTMIYKSSLAKKHVYASKNYEEDSDWVKRASKDIKIQGRIDKILYYYDYVFKPDEVRKNGGQ